MGVINRILSTEPGKLFGLAYRCVKGVLEEWWAHAGGLELKESELPGLVMRNTLAPSDAAMKLIEGIVSVVRLTDAGLEHAQKAFPDGVRELLVGADRVCEGRFHLLGEEVDFSDGINWHLDFRHNHEFSPGVFYRNIRKISPSGSYDLKYPLELSRLQHLPRLALAWRSTGDRKYLDALVGQTEDWIRKNPPGFGPNWIVTMDVSIRAVNMALAFGFAGEVSYDSGFAVRLASSLIEHGRFIINHLEWSGDFTNNHYIANLAGLVVLGSVMAPIFTDGVRWRDSAYAELKLEAEKQVYPDGWDFEASTSYHRFVLECLLVSVIFAERTGNDDPGNLTEIIGRMAGFCRDVSLPGGEFPLIGDNDSGTLVSLRTGQAEIADGLLALCSAWLYRPDLKPAVNGDYSEIAWFLGTDGLKSYHAMKPSDKPVVSSFPDGGLYIARLNNGRDLLTFRLGPPGQNGNGGHAHNDQLSITLWLDGEPVIVDPGMPCYTSDFTKRNLFRSTRSHATILLDDLEQSRFDETNIFTLASEIVPGPVSVAETESGITISGAFRGYGAYSEKQVRMERNIAIDKIRRQFEINDHIRLSDEVENVTIFWHFPLAPGLHVESSGEGRIRLATVNGKPVAEVLFLAGWQMEQLETSYSPRYGEEVGNVTMKFIPPRSNLDSNFIIRPQESHR